LKTCDYAYRAGCNSTVTSTGEPVPETPSPPPTTFTADTSSPP
jgi:hypothetical protein